MNIIESFMNREDHGIRVFGGSEERTTEEVRGSEGKKTPTECPQCNTINTSREGKGLLAIRGHGTK